MSRARLVVPASALPFAGIGLHAAEFIGLVCGLIALAALRYTADAGTTVTGVSAT